MNYSLTKEDQASEGIHTLLRLAFGTRNSIESDKETPQESFTSINVLTAIEKYDKRHNENSTSMRMYYSELSEIVHPNYLSNIIHFKENRHFWKINFSTEREKLLFFLTCAQSIFEKTLDEISSLPNEIELGLKLNPK